MLACDEVAKLTETNREWLEKLYQLSEEEDFELVLFVAPTRLDVDDQKQINAAKEFATSRGVGFLDFNRMAAELELDYSRDFSDGTHLNGYGAEKLTKYFGTYLSERYTLDDHRGEESYYQWEQSYANYEHRKKNVVIKSLSDSIIYFEMISNLKDYTCLVSF